MLIDIDRLSSSFSLTRNLYYLDNNEANVHKCTLQDMSDQEIEFSKMSRELSDYKGSISTLKMYLQYCPDAVTYLLDRCLNIECMEQVQVKLIWKITTLIYLTQSIFSVCISITYSKRFRFKDTYFWTSSYSIPIVP